MKMVKEARRKLSEGYVLLFGKYAGKTLGEVVDEDVAYLDWLAGLTDLRDPLKGHVLLLCREYVEEIKSAISDRELSYGEEGIDGEW